MDPRVDMSVKGKYIYPGWHIMQFMPTLVDVRDTMANNLQEYSGCK